MGGLLDRPRAGREAPYDHGLCGPSRAAAVRNLNNLIGVSATLVQAAATIAVLLLCGGGGGLAAFVIPLTLLTQIPMLAVIGHIAPDLRFGLRGAQSRLVRTVASFSTSLLVIGGGSVVKTKTDEIVIAAALPLATVAPFSIARRLSELPSLLTYQFVRVLFPLASELHGAKNRARLRALYLARHDGAPSAARRALHRPRAAA